MLTKVVQPVVNECIISQTDLVTLLITWLNFQM